jgi:hypothetical protein
MGLENGMYFRLAKMATIVKGVKVFRKGLAALGALVALMPLLGFAVLMYFVMTAEKTFHVRDQKSLLSFLDLSHRFLFHYHISIIRFSLHPSILTNE